MEVYNIHVPQLYHSALRYSKELHKSQSANASMTNMHDLLRVGTYLSSLRVLLGNIGLPSTMDLPESDPRPYPIRDREAFADVENEVVNQLLLLYDAFLTELSRSQTARISSGMISHDRKRLLAIITEMESYLNNYAMKVQPEDLPESSPRAKIQGAGLNTINQA